MAKFLMAKFLSQALEWKVRLPTAQSYAGLRYEPFIYEKARLAFPEYSKLYPDNKQFTEKFVKDLRNRNEQLLKTLNPQVITPEHEAQDKRFETEARLDQQQVAQIAPEQASPPFSLSTITGLPAQEKGESAGKNFATNAGIFFKKNVGKYITFGNAITGAFSAIGGLTGGVFTNGNPLGVIAGAGAGGIGSVWARSREGLRSLGNFANGGINSMVRLSNEVSGGGLSLAGPKKRVWVWALGLFVFMFGFSLIGGIISPQTTPSGQAAPVVGGPSYAGGDTGILSCPLNDGRITCNSQNAGGNCNHCAANYAPYTCPAGGTTGRETAIDVVSSDRLVFLPFIGGGSVTWIIDEAGTPIDPAEGGGIVVVANAKLAEKTYRIRMVHITKTSLSKDQQVPSGTLVGQYGPATSHVHIAVQEDGIFKPADTYFKMCTK